MSTVSTTVNVNDQSPCPGTPGSFNVRVSYTEADAGHLFGVFTTRERAEQCVLILAGRAGVIKAAIEEA